MEELFHPNINMSLNSEAKAAFGWVKSCFFFFFHNDFYIEEVLCVKVCMFVFMFAMFYIDLEYVEQRP